MEEILDIMMDEDYINSMFPDKDGYMFFIPSRLLWDDLAKKGDE